MSFLFSLFACGSDPYKVYRKAVISHREGTLSAEKLIDALVAYVVTGTAGTDAEILGNLCFVRWSDRIEILHPRRAVLKSDQAGKFRNIALSDSGIAASDGTRIFVFPRDGGRGKEVVCLPDSKSDIGIRALAWVDRTIYYYSGGKIWFTDSEGKNRGEVMRGSTFPAPYGRFYDVLMTSSGPDLAIVAGMAGSYNFSVIDVKNRRIRVKKWAIASRRIFFAGNEIHVLRGGSGNWSLAKAVLPDDSFVTLKSFHGLSDIVLFQDGFLYREKDITRMVSGSVGIGVPFDMEIAGGDGEYLFARIRGDVRIIPFKRLLLALETLKDEVPGFAGIQ